MPTSWYDGQALEGTQLSLSIHNPGLLYGATVFTTLRVYEKSLNHSLTAWQAHCDRLQASIDAFGWRSPDWSRLRLGAQQIADQYPVLRMTLFPCGTELITGRDLPENLELVQQQGVTAWLAEASIGERSLPDHKTGNYLPAWLAQQAASRHGAQEAILTDSAGHWLETSTGNLWGWAEGHWWTPPMWRPDSKKPIILPGIVRSQLISWLKWQNERIEEKVWSMEQALSFEALAYSNSVRQVVPIHTVMGTAGRQIYNVSHPCIQQLRRFFDSQREIQM